MPNSKLINKWGLEWYQKNSLDGVTQHLIYENTFPCIFRSRKQALEYRDKNYGYIRLRKDLRQEPHGWRLPKVVRIVSIRYKRFK